MPVNYCRSKSSIFVEIYILLLSGSNNFRPIYMYLDNVTLLIIQLLESVFLKFNLFY